PRIFRRQPDAHDHGAGASHGAADHRTRGQRPGRWFGSMKIEVGTRAWLGRLRLSTRVTDAGLAHFKDCKYLRDVWLEGTRVTNAGLAGCNDCKSLDRLRLPGTAVSDAGLAHLKNCKNLGR